MRHTINDVDEAETSLSQLIDRAAADEEIGHRQGGRPLARPMALECRTVPRRAGAWTGRVRIADDFDAPLPTDIAAAFGAVQGDDDER